jgi:hypothetical protein
MEGRMTARVLMTSVAILGATLAVGAAAPEAPAITVHEADGAYAVSAEFTVPQTPTVARAVLTDYANIPRFMPDVRKSLVLAREDGHVRVEQEAVSKFVWFSKQVHLVLDVQESADTIRFRDDCFKSFERYEGSWTLAPRDTGTVIRYELTARPAFSVPGFVLRKLLNRDATVMIDRLRSEIAARAYIR